jgi:hypothetical protein
MEKNYLINIFKALNGLQWTKKFAWTGQDRNMTRPEIRVFAPSASLFEGVSSLKLGKQTLVTGLNLNGVGCEGGVPDAMVNFETCKLLSMNWNLISGSLPREIGSLGHLETLDLSCNNLSGELDPQSFSMLTNLRILKLADNYFTGEIPDCFHDMKLLKALDLSNNQLVGCLPRSMSKLGKLETLKIHSNNLTGLLNEWLSDLKSLKTLNLSKNSLSGNVDPLFECVELETLNLSHNDLYGILPLSISKLEKIRVLYLQNNRLRGYLPDEICTLSNLKRLNLSHNNFRGSLPANIGALGNLETLILEDNEFIGPIPRSLSQLTNLHDYSCIKNIPSKDFEICRGFVRYEFDRIHIFGPEAGLNNVTWDYIEKEECPGFPNVSRPKEEEDPFWLFEKRLER